MMFRSRSVYRLWLSAEPAGSGYFPAVKFCEQFPAPALHCRTAFPRQNFKLLDDSRLQLLILLGDISHGLHYKGFYNFALIFQVFG